MADLTERLPLTNTTNRIIEDPAPVPVVAEILNFAGDAVSTFASFQRERAEMRRNKKKAEEDAAKSAATTAAFRSAVAVETAASTPAPVLESSPYYENIEDDEALVGGISADVFGDVETTVSPGVMSAVTESANRLNSVSAAVSQHRMPPVAVAAAHQSEFNRLITQFPGNEEEILEVYKKAGIDTNLFRASRNAADQLDEDREAGQRGVEDIRKMEHNFFEKGLLALPPEMVANASREDIIARGMMLAGTEYELGQIKTRTDIAVANSNLSDTERKRAFEDGDLNIRNQLTNMLWGDMSPLISNLQQAASILGRDVSGPEQQAQFEKFSTDVNSMAQNFIDQALIVATRSGYRGDLNGLRTELSGFVKRGLDLFASDFDVSKANNRALTAFKTTFQLETYKAMPVYMALRDAGISPDTMPGFLEGLEANPELLKQFRQEIQGFNIDFTKDRASERILNLVRLMRGEDTLADWNPREAAAQMPEIHASTNSLVRSYNRGENNDVDSTLNMIGNTTFAANTLGASSSSAAFGFATAAMSGDTVIALQKAMNDPNADKTEVKATVQAVRATNAHLVTRMRERVPKINRENSRYFQIVWDDKNGKYTIDDSRKREAIRKTAATRSPRIGGGDSKFSGLASTVASEAIKNVEVPKEMSMLVRGLNLGLTSITTLNKMDETAPKGNDLELRRYYGNGQPLKSMQNQEAPVNPNKELGKIMENIRQSLDANLIKGNEDPGYPRGNPDRVDFRANPNYETYSETISSAAKTYGIPEDILGSLLQFESGLDPSATGPVIESGTHKGDRAMGIGQVMAKTAAAFGVTDRASLTPEQQIELAAKVLADNKKNGGSWKDAISMYFTGVDYATAKKQNRTDGYTDVFNYVESIVNG